MKKGLLFMVLMLLMGTQTTVNAQELTLSDVQNSRCLNSRQARANGRAKINEDNRRPTIILTKEGTILTVQLFNYEANCGTTDFEVMPNISGGSNGTPYSVSIQVIPMGDEDMDCICPYNISFTIRDLEATDFFFSCCWFQGQVTLTENKPLVLGDINEVVMAEVNIDGLNYTLEYKTNTARLIAAKRGYDIKGELDIPSELSYDGRKFIVTGIGDEAFSECNELTAVTIPSCVTSIGECAFVECNNLANVYCHAEEVPDTHPTAFGDIPTTYWDFHLPIASATLHVPAGSIDKYKTTWPWSEFGNIVALTPVPMKDIMNYSTYFTITQEHQYVTLYIEPWWRSVKKNEKEYTMFSGNFKGINYVDTLMLLRQDEAKCYFYDTKTGTEHLLFDFSLQKGDVYNDDFNNIEYEVTDVRDSIIGNESLRLIELISQEGKHDIWLEGIGSIYTGLLRAYSNYKDAYLLMCACPEWSTEWEEGCLHLFFPNNQFIRTADMTIKEPHWDRPLETEEDWEAYQEWRNAPTGLNAEFSGDTLHVWGRVRTSCGLCPYISSELKDNNVSVTLYRYPGPEPDCISAYDVDGRIPGFQRGIYEVRLYNKTIKLVCSATSKGIMPFVQDGKVWTYEASNYIYDWEERFSLEGDTIINSCKCLKLYYTCQFYQQEHLYKGAMFEEEGKVYFFASGSTTPVLMYDFSYEPGTIIKVGEFELRINETRLVKYRGEYLKVIDYCILGDEEYPFEGIEGLGFIGGGLTCFIDGYTPANTGGERHLKTCSINGEVVFDLQDFYTSAQIVTKDEVTFTRDQMATIILPTAPDASKGKYYRLDRVEDGQIVFEQELQPQARVPYIIVPSEDFCIDPSSLDLEGLTKDSVSIEGVSFVGSYVRKELPALTGGDGGGSLYYDLIDKTHDCSLSPLGEKGKGAIIGALRAYLLVNWSDPYNPGGTRGPNDKPEIVLKDNPNDIKTLSNSHLKGEDIYDLSGKKIVNRKSSNNKSHRGIFIEDGKKKVSR